MKIYYNGESKTVKHQAKNFEVPANGGHTPISELLWYFYDNNLKYTVQGTNKIRKPFGDNLYFIEAYKIPDKNFFKEIPAEVLQAFREKKLKLVISFMFEGFDFSVNNWFDNIHNLFIQYNLKNAKIFLLYGNLHIKNMYKKYLKKRKPAVRFTEVYGIDYFKTHYKNEYKKYYKKNIVDPREKKDKIFLNYNGGIRGQRFSLVAELKRRQIENYGYVSFVGRYFDGDLRPYRSYCERMFKSHGTRQQLDYVINYIDNWQPQYLDIINLDGTNDRQFDIFHYNSTYFSLVSETLVDTGLFITEKTYKPIAIGHPFIIYGHKGILSYLKEQGYKTFPELFDESYDEEENEILRLNKILDTVENFCKMPNSEQEYLYNKILGKVHHNRMHFLKQNNQTSLDIIIKEIKEL